MPKIERKRIPVQFRTMEIAAREDTKETRTIDLSFSSEEPYERSDGIEILDHSPEAVNLSRLNNGAPLLVNHWIDDHVGVVENAHIDGDHRVGRATVRFGKSARAKEIMDDVIDRIRQHVSVAYRVTKKVVEKAENGIETYRASWFPLEISFASIAADDHVGPGRNEELNQDNEVEVVRLDPAPVETPVDEPEAASPAEGTEPPAQDEEKPEAKAEPITITKEEKTMSEDKKIDEVKIDEKKLERTRASELLAIGEQCDCAKEARTAISEGTSVADFQGWVLKNKFNAKPMPSPEIGMSEKDMDEWSFIKGIKQLLEDGKVSGIIKEASDAACKVSGRASRGFTVPYDIQKRDATIGTDAQGGYTGADKLQGPMIEALLNEMIVPKLGATILNGLAGNTAILIPRKSATATSYYVAEAGTVTESQWTLGQVSLTPKTIGCFTDVTRQLILQGALSTEQLIRQDLMESIAHAVDLAAFYGNAAGTTTLATQPIGLLNDTTITRTAFGSTALGAVPDYAELIGMQTTVGAANGWGQKMAYVTNHSIRGVLKTTPSSTAIAGLGFICQTENGQDYIDGLPLYVTNSIPSTIALPSTTLGAVGAGLLFGNFQNLLVGFWSGVDIKLDTATGSAADITRILAFQDFDVTTRQPSAFVRVTDAKAATT